MLLLQGDREVRDKAAAERSAAALAAAEAEDERQARLQADGKTDDGAKPIKFGRVVGAAATESDSVQAAHKAAIKARMAGALLKAAREERKAAADQKKSRCVLLRLTIN